MLDPRAPFIAHGLLRVTTATAAADAAAMRAESDARDLAPSGVTEPPLPTLTYEEWQARLAHEAAHSVGALHGRAADIEALIRPDGTGWCAYGRIENPVDEIMTCLVGVAAEARSYPPSLRHYSNGCFDFINARMLIERYNAPGRWPPLTCEAAATAAVEFVDARWSQIRALSLALGSAGSLTDFEVRLFAGCGYDG